MPATAQPKTITVPADYLEDVRSALVAEINSDADMLRANQAEVESGPEDRDCAVRLLHNDLQALDQLLSASTDTEITMERETLFHTLEAMCRLLTKRLAEEMEYGPLDMLNVLALVARMEWAAKQAMAIYPQLAVA
jgi:hypothetical protein